MKRFVPDDGGGLYYFDAEAGERPIRFIETFCRHYQGPLVGKPFLLHEEQKRIIRDIYGWKVLATMEIGEDGKPVPLTGKRRFTDVYWEAAVGTGKTPIMGALGLFGLMADGEAGAQVFSIAGSYGQAKLTMDAAKAFRSANVELSSRTKAVQREIRFRRNGSKWEIVAKDQLAGKQPTMILGDEIHQWKSPIGYHDLHDRMGKRVQPLSILATNSGESRASFCWLERVKAIRVIEAKPDADPHLYPIIWAAEESAKNDDPRAWRDANPLMGVTMTQDAIAKNYHKAVNDPDPAALIKFRRLYLSIWPKSGGGRWLNLGEWDDVVDNFNASDLIGLPLYIGLDLSLGDDLCAAAYVWPTPDGRMFISSQFWVPKMTAERYEEKDGVPYKQWAAQKHITLLDTPTIGPKTRRMFADRIIDVSKRHTVKVVGYDAYRADETIAVLEAAGLTCVPIRQGHGLSAGCFELERRVKEKSVVIAPNDVLTWNAENVVVQGDNQGNIWPSKPNAADKYKGLRQLKIDGISAVVNALTEARKHAFPIAANTWKGSVECLHKSSQARPATSASSTSTAARR